MDAQFGIPSLDLLHDDKPTMFAIRTMEYIYDIAKEKGLIDMPHRHNYYTVLFSKSACGKHYIDYHEYDISSEILFFVAPGQVHQVITYSRPIGFAIMFTDEFLSSQNIPNSFINNLGLFSELPGTPPLIIDPIGLQNLSDLSEKILEAFHSNDSYKADIIGSYLKLFLIESNKYAIKPDINNDQALQSSKTILIDFKKSVESNFRQKHKVNAYAEELNLTPDYLNSIIKNAIGKTAKDFIQDRIIIEAKRLAVHSNLSSKEISYELGFEDPAHFSKFFKKKENITFSQFREAKIVDL